MRQLIVIICLTLGASGAFGAGITIELIGDSTQTDNAGYGRGFCANLSSAIHCVNMARGGASTKTFRQLGIWDKAIASRPDYMLIQFGHNDEVSGPQTDRQVPIDGYKENLRGFIAQARSAGVQPILVTPLTRRYFGKDGKIHSDLTAYCDAMKEVAGEMHAPLIDLQARSIAYLDSIGEAAGAKLGITKKDKDGKLGPDKTHLNWQGSYVFGRMVAEDLGKAEPALANYVLATPATLPAEGQLAMRVIEGASFQIAIVSDSAMPGQAGWGAGFCATLTPNVTCRVMGSRGSNPLASKAQYYFIDLGNADKARQMVLDVRSAGAIPVLLSPLSARAYPAAAQPKGEALRSEAAAIRQIASEENVTYVDLLGMSDQYLRTPRTGRQSAATIGRLIADNVIRTQVELGPNVIGLPEGAEPVLSKQAAPTDGK